MTFAKATLSITAKKSAQCCNEPSTLVVVMRSVIMLNVVAPQ
jgi:hypothetical protein